VTTGTRRMANDVVRRTASNTEPANQLGHNRVIRCQPPPFILALDVGQHGVEREGSSSLA